MRSNPSLTQSAIAESPYSIRNNVSFGFVQELIWRSREAPSGFPPGGWISIKGGVRQLVTAPVDTQSLLKITPNVRRNRACRLLKIAQNVRRNHRTLFKTQSLLKIMPNVRRNRACSLLKIVQNVRRNRACCGVRRHCPLVEESVAIAPMLQRTALNDAFVRHLPRGCGLAPTCGCKKYEHQQSKYSCLLTHLLQ